MTNEETEIFLTILTDNNLGYYLCSENTQIKLWGLPVCFDTKDLFIKNLTMLKELQHKESRKLQTRLQSVSRCIIQLEAQINKVLTYNEDL